MIVYLSENPQHFALKVFIVKEIAYLLKLRYALPRFVYPVPVV
jgi:hypothetical protein